MISNRRNRMPLTLVSPGCALSKQKCCSVKKFIIFNCGSVLAFGLMLLREGIKSINILQVLR